MNPSKAAVRHRCPSHIPRGNPIVGSTFGKLTVLRLIREQPLTTQTCECLCQCGNIKTYVRQNLIYGRTTSCGCSRRGPFGLSNARRVFYQYRANARKRKLSFEITFEDFLRIVTRDCAYCGCAPAMEMNAPRSHGEFRYNGIDRTDRATGYIQGNIKPCCFRCNDCKGTLNEAQFLEAVKSIYEWRMK